MRDADVVINLVGILHEGGRQRFESVQTFGAGRWRGRPPPRRAPRSTSRRSGPTRSRLALCPLQGDGRKAGARREPDATILRPSILFGPEDDFFNRFAALARIRRRCR